MQLVDSRDIVVLIATLETHGVPPFVPLAGLIYYVYEKIDDISSLKGNVLRAFFNEKERSYYFKEIGRLKSNGIKLCIF